MSASRVFAFSGGFPDDAGEDDVPRAVLHGFHGAGKIRCAMTGDLTGESDVAGLVPLQDAYNRMTSDDQDALRFNMFPQRIFADASQECLEKIQITPGGIVDLQTDPAAIDRQAKYGLLEAGFGYHDRIEGALERVMSDMYQIMGVPKATVEDYKGVAASGKAMRALYWPLITRCEEKWAAWDAALTWLVRMLVAIDGAYGANRFGAAQYSVKIEHRDIERDGAKR